MPRHIAKYGKPLPYFMKYRSDYYKNQKLSRAASNMNRLCWEIEKWERQIRRKRSFSDFDYKIMIDESVEIDDFIFQSIEKIFLRFCDEMKQLKSDEIEIKRSVKNFRLNWEYYYDFYKNECERICPDNKMLANIVVKLCYENHPSKNRKFIWRVAGSGIVENIPQTNVCLPVRDDKGEHEYLGKRYKMIPYVEVKEE